MSSPLRVQLAVTAVVVLLVVAVASLWSRHQHRQRAPDDVSLQAAAQAIARDLQPGDALAVVPGWSAAQQWRFAAVWQQRGLDFNAAYKLGDPLTAWDVDGFVRLWVVTTHGRTHTMDQGRLLQRRDLGHGTGLELWSLPASRTRFDMGKRLADAKVSREGEGDCTWDDGHFRCPGGGEHWRQIWYFDGEVGDGRHKCIFLQPTRDGAATRLSWHDVPAGTELTGHVGLRLWAVRVDEGSDLRVRVLAGARVLWQTAIRRGDFSWRPFRVPLQPTDQGQPLTFEFVADKIAWRQACFDARVLGPPTGRADAPTALAVQPTPAGNP